MSELTQVLGRIEREGEAVAVVFERNYATTATDLWSACTDPERLARWFAPVTGDLRPGGAFTIHFDDADTPSCRVVTCAAPDLLVWEWPVGDGAGLVTVRVAVEGEGARLTLRHERLTAAKAPAYAAGWDAYVRSLEAHLDGAPAPDWDATWTALHARYAASSEASPR